MSIYDAGEEGSTPETPSSGRRLLYPKAGGWFSKNTSGVESRLVDAAEKDASDGVAGLTLFKINFKNVANTFTSFFTNSNTAARTYTFPDRDGTIAVREEVPTVNDVINGQFTIAQAGTSFAAPANGAYDLDGWLNGNTSAAVFTVAQVTGSSTGKFARQVTITTADASVAAGDAVHDTTKIEGYNVVKYIGNTFVVSFRAKVPVTGIHCVALRNSGDDRSYVVEISFPTANTWQDCSFVVTGGLPTAGTWNYTSGAGLKISFVHMAGSTYQTTAGAWQTGNFMATANQVNDCATNSNVWALEDVKINSGTIPMPDSVSYEAELLRCKRYYEAGVSLFIGYVSAASGLAGYSHGFKATKRATPTLTSSSTTTLNVSVYDARDADVNGFRWHCEGTAAGSVRWDGTWTANSRL